MNKQETGLIRDPLAIAVRHLWLQEWLWSKQDGSISYIPVRPLMWSGFSIEIIVGPPCVKCGGRQQHVQPPGTYDPMDEEMCGQCLYDDFVRDHDLEDEDG